jgi:hypothetical protein
MSGTDSYVMLMASLPRSERLFLAKQPPISRLKLERRLQQLTAEDRGGAANGGRPRLAREPPHRWP